MATRGHQQQQQSSALYRVQSGVCPDEKCQTKLYFPAYDTSVECTNCGQRHEKSSLHEVDSVTNPTVALHNIARNLLIGSVPKKGVETVRVLGLSNYLCKLLSPLLTSYGMDKVGRARLLSELNRKEVFDCSVLGDRAFQISPEHVGIAGYGRDLSGSARYLKETLEVVQRSSQQGEEVLVPIHADGDGHCLVHAISRALVGRELFWHALRLNLEEHFRAQLDRYRALFHDFIDAREWKDIINECDPGFQPGECETLGLRNIHVLGLANVLHRPIILLDSLSGMQSPGEYSGVFLPGLIPPEECRGKDGQLNKPLCIAWSSSGRNHYISLVGVKGRPQPRLPHWMLSKAWGFPYQLINQYIEFDEDNMCTVGGERTLQDKYIQRLATAMEGVFVEKYGVHPSLVTDMHQFVFKRSGFANIQMDLVTEATQRAVREERLYRCLTCSALLEQTWPAEWFKPGGDLYTLAIKCHGVLNGSKRYSFPTEGIICTYDPLHNVLVPDTSTSKMQQCYWCQGNQVRKVKSDGSVVYVNGDRTQNLAPTTRCSCGYKHYWDGKEYDNMPESIPVEMTWNGKSVSRVVAWFQYETEPSLNSNAYQLASQLVQQFFPGEFGSERLVQNVADQILRFTATKVGNEEYKPLSLSEMPMTSDQEPTALVTSDQASPTSFPGSPRSASSQPASPRELNLNTEEKTPTKIILTGFKSKTFHKEELTASETEKAIKARIEARARTEQSLASKSEARKKERPSSSPKQQLPPERKQSPAPAANLGQKQGQKKIRLTTLDGRQVTLTLEAETTFAELQDKIASQLQIPAARQKIRYGFPPRQLECQPGEEAEPVPLQNGDRVSVEIISDPSDTREGAASPNDITLTPISSNLMTSNPASLYSNPHPTDTVPGKMSEEDSSEIDVQVSALTLMASLTGQDIWSYAQNMPSLFERGGIFYKKMKRDVGLADGTHCILPSFPTKNFVYVAKEDHVELCLDSLGHFAIGPGLVERIQQAGLAGPSATGHDTGARQLTAGGSGVVNPGARRPTSAAANQRAFTGQAHVLSSTSSGLARHQQSAPGSGRRSNTAASDPPSDFPAIGMWNREEGAAGMGGGMPWAASQPMDMMDLTTGGGSGPVQYGRRAEQEGSSSGAYSQSKPKKLGPGYTVLENVPTADSASDADDSDEDNSL